MSKRTNRRVRAIVSGAIVAALPAVSQAGSYYWDTGSGTWSNGANWSNSPTTGGTTGVIPGAADSATLNQLAVNGAETIQLDGDQAIQSLSITNTGTTLIQSDSTTPRTLTIGSGGLLIHPTAGAVTFGNATNVLNLSLAASQNWTNYASTSLTVVNGVTLTNAGSQTLTIGGTGNAFLNGVLSNGAGTLNLAKTGTGTLTLAGVNTFSGTTTITGGTLSIAADTALGAAPGAATAGSLTIGSNGVLATTSTLTLNANRGIALSGTGGINVGTGTLTYGGVIANATASASALSLTGGGTLLLTGTSTYTGSTTIATGSTLKLGNGTTNGAISGTGGVVNNGTLDITTSATAQSYTGTISGTGNLLISGTGGGVVTLSGANSYTGTTTIGTLNNATLQGTIVTGTSPLGINGAVTLNAGNTGGTGSYLQLGTGTSTATITGKTLNIVTGTTASIRVALLANTTTGTNAWNGNIVLANSNGAQFYNNGSGGTLQLGANASNTVTGSSSITFRGGSNTTNAIVVNSTVNLPALNFGRTDSATVLINSPYNVWGSTSNSIGIMRVGVNEAMSPISSLSLGQTNSSSATLDLNGKTQTFTSLSDSGATGTSTTVITSGVAGGVFTLNTTTANTFGASGTGGLFTGGANLSIAKIGSGSLTIRSKAVNTYTGSTTVNQGSLILDFANLTAASNLINSSSALVLGGGTFQVTALASTATSQTVNGLTVNAGASTITLNNTVTGTPNTLLTLGAISRGTTGGTVVFNLPGGTRAASNGIVTSTANDASGILGGWATVGSDWATVDTTTGNTITSYAAASYTGVTVGGTVASDTTKNIQFTGAGPGVVGPAAAGTTDVNTLQSIATAGAVTYTATAGTDVLRLGATGGVMLSSAATGALILGDTANNGLLTAGGSTVANNPGSISFWNNTASTALTVNLTIADNGSGAVTVNKAGAGPVTLNGTNTYTGGTSIGGGTVTLGSTAALGSANATLTLTGGTLDLAGNSIGVGNLTGFGGTIQSTGGTPTLTIGNNNATGGVFRGVIANGSGVVNLVKAGTGTLTLAGNNTYTNTTINASSGTLQIGADTATGTLGTGTVSIGSGSTLAFNRADAAYSVASAITGAGGVSFIGRGTITLTSASNAWTGPTTISAGTLALSGGNNRLPTAATLAYTNTVPFASWLNLGTTSQTIAGMTFPNLTTGVYVSGTGASTLTINGTAADLNIGPTTTTATITLDMSGLSNFVYNSSGRTLRVGIPVGGTGGSATNLNAFVTLAATNTITAAALAVNDQGLGNLAGTSTLLLGQSNTIKVADVNVGYGSRNGALLAFNSNVTNPSATFRNTDGTSAVATFNIGKIAHTGNATFTDIADFSRGSIDLLATSMVLGDANTLTSPGRGGTVTGTFILGAGTATVGTMTVGRITNGTGGTVNTGVTYSGNGVVTLNSAAGTLNVTTMDLATNTITDSGGTARSVTGTLNLVDGTIKATNIQRGTQGGTATAAVAFNWTAGTLQNVDGTVAGLPATDLTVTNVPVTLLTNAPHTLNITGTQIGTIASTSVVSGVGGITKTGAGTAVLAAANTYTGGTSITSGLLLVNADNSAANGAVFVATGGTLGGNGKVGGATTITGTISPGASAGSSGTLSLSSTLAFTVGGKYAFELSTAGTPSTILGSSTPASPQTNHDLISGTGVLDFTSSTLDVTSLDSTGFDQNSSYSWLIATSTGGVTGSPTLGTIGGSSFTGYSGTFSVATDTNNVYLNYTAIPEPGTLAVAATAIGMLSLRRRRRC